MRQAIVIAALLACNAASPPPEPSITEPEIRELQVPAEPGEAVCRDRIHTVREERALPTIKRETVDPDAPLLIAAVDHRIDGCSVMVMRHDTRDVRPIPKPDERAPLLRRLQ